jgi:hypothetical protein
MITFREETADSGEKFIVRSNENGTESWIPADPANSDYQRYLNPEAEDFTPMISANAKEL